MTRLRGRPLADPFHIVLVEPEIPQNTGNIGRLAAATASPLHLVGPLGFRIDEPAVKRAGLDYWPLVDLRQHASLEHLRHALLGSRLLLFSAHSKRSYTSVEFRPGDALVFGKESVGLDQRLCEKHADPDLGPIGIPTLGAVRSLNLANAVSIVLYEALRQSGALNDTFVDDSV